MPLLQPSSRPGWKAPVMKPAKLVAPHALFPWDRRPPRLIAISNYVREIRCNLAASDCRKSVRRRERERESERKPCSSEQQLMSQIVRKVFGHRLAEFPQNVTYACNYRQLSKWIWIQPDFQEIYATVIVDCWFFFVCCSALAMHLR